MRPLSACERSTVPDAVSAPLTRRTETLQFSARIGRSDYKEMSGDDCARYERAAKALDTFVDALAADFGVADRDWLFAILAEVAADETRETLSPAVLDHIHAVSGRANATVLDWGRI